MIRVEVNGVTYTDFIDVSVDTALDDIAWTFSLTVASNVVADFPIKVGNLIKIYADDELVLTGYVERNNGSYDTQNHQVTISGRSKTADLVDSTIDGSFQFESQVNLETVAKELITNLFKDPIFPLEFEATPDPEKIIQVVVEGDIDDFLANESLSEDMGQTYFEILEKLARNRQILVTTNGAANVVFTRGKGSSGSNFVLQNVSGPGHENNNIKSVPFYFQDRSSMFYVYSCNSQPHLGGFKVLEDLPTDKLLVENGRVIDNRIRVSRKLYFTSENSSDDKEVKNRALWEANVRASRSMGYQAVVQGHSVSRKGSSGRFVWKINNSVDVNDEKAGINSNLLITGVRYSQNLTSGSQSIIACQPPNSYTFPEKKIPPSNIVINKFVDELDEPGELPYIFSETDSGEADIP